jgi:hypothetical protein
MTKRKVKRYAEGDEVESTNESVRTAIQKPEMDDSGARQASSSQDATSKPAAKAPVVTKEELAKSGLSLRDYMNKQQGLTRRGDSSSASTSSSAPAKSSSTSSGGSGRGGQGGPTAGQATSGDYKWSSSEPPTSEQAAANRQAVLDKVKAAGSSAANYVRNLAKSPEEHGSYRGFDGKVHTYKKGGSTASSRADGIAQRGKTRGVMR